MAGHSIGRFQPPIVKPPEALSCAWQNTYQGNRPPHCSHAIHLLDAGRAHHSTEEYQQLLALLQDMSEQLAQMRHRQKMTNDTVSAIINGMKTFGRVLNTIWPNIGGEAGPRQTMQFPFATPAPSPPLSPIYTIRTLSPEPSELSRPSSLIQDIRNDLPSSPCELLEPLRPSTLLQDAVDNLPSSPTPCELGWPSGQPVVRGLICYMMPSDLEHSWPSPFLLRQRLLPSNEPPAPSVNTAPSSTQVMMFGTIPPASSFVQHRFLSSVKPAQMLTGWAIFPAATPSNGKDAQTPLEPGRSQPHTPVDSIPLLVPPEAALLLGQTTGDGPPPTQPQLPTGTIHALLDYVDGSDADGMEGIE